MNINRIQNNLSIKNYATAKSNSAEKPTFEAILNANKDKGTNLNEIFEEASRTHGVPTNLLVAVAKVESNYNSNAVSRSGASGVMQLMPATARGLGVTDVFDARQNINGGAKYLASLYKKYDGDLELTLAGYNAGPGNVAKYGGIPPFKETQNYIVKVKQALVGENVDFNLSNYKAATNPKSDNLQALKMIEELRNILNEQIIINLQEITAKIRN
ncbi:MAG TPA: lytic transglycosylase domain-containing protein [Clostridiales bacterium]|nr:lytic transglycosylase domain-containing protein [Clostridiales bacterium]